MDPLDRWKRTQLELLQWQAASDPNVHGEKRFVIGDMFPADDPVARFMAGLAVISSDWWHVTCLRSLPGVTSEQNLFLTRQQVVMLHEACKFVAESRKRFSEVDKFLGGLDAGTQVLLKRITDLSDERSAEHLEWKEALRHTTAHYPAIEANKYRRGEEPIGEALKKVARETGRVTWDNSSESGVQYEFVTQIVVQMLPPPEDLVIGTLSSHRDFVEVVVRAFSAYWARMAT